MQGVRKQFTVTVGTPLERSRVPLRLLMMALDAEATSSKGTISPVQLQRELGLRSYQRARRIAHRVRSLFDFVLSCPDPQ